MSIFHVYVCDHCEAEARIPEWDELPDGWAKNVDNDDFCPACALRLDPPEDDD